MEQDTLSEVANRATMRGVAWRLLPFLLVIYIVAWLDRVNVGFAALQMNRDLGFGPAVYGFGAGVFFVGYAAFEVPSNLMLARVGARRWIARIMISWGIVSTAMVFVHSPASFYVLRFLLGAAEAGCYPGIFYYLGGWFPRVQRARSLAIFAISIPIASILGGPLAGSLLSLDALLGISGWQWLFVVEGLPAVILGLLVWRWLPDSPSVAKWLNQNQKASLLEQLELDRRESGSLQHASVRDVLSSPTIWMLGLAQALATTQAYGLQFWVPQILKTLSGRSDFVVGFLAALPYIAAPISMLLVARHSDLSQERCLHVAVPSFLASAAFLGASYASTPAIAILALTVAAAAMYARIGPLFAIPTLLFDGAPAAVAIAMMNTLGSVGGFVGPYAVGIVKNATGSYRGGLLFLAVAGVLAGGIMITLRRHPAIQRRVAATAFHQA
jgi:ACS family tartrate transporter-like MFS transporter